MKHTAPLCVLVVLAVLPASHGAPLELVTRPEVGLAGYTPAQASLADEPTETLIAEPVYRGTPLYTSIALGNGNDTAIAMVLDEYVSGDREVHSALYVDRNNDEDLTNDGGPIWCARGSEVPHATVLVLASYADGEQRLRAEYPVTLYRFVPAAGEPDYLTLATLRERLTAAQHADPRASKVFYFGSGVRTGTARIRGLSVRVALTDEDSDGLFDDAAPASEADAPAGIVYVDRDRNGALLTDARSAETYLGPEPFEFRSKGWRLAGASPAGDRVWFERTDEEFEAKPYTAAGYPALDFEATDTAGQTFRLSDYRGRVVLLDFWATWCGPCKAEIPNVVAAYEKYHERGFEVVGISLDRGRADLDAYLAENPAMTWRQVCDEGYWDAEIGNLWGIHSIPAPFLIGRDGVIYGKVRGSQLEEGLAVLLDGAPRPPSTQPTFVPIDPTPRATGRSGLRVPLRVIRLPGRPRPVSP